MLNTALAIAIHGGYNPLPYLINIHCSKCNTNRANYDKSTNYSIIPTKTLSVTVSLSLIMETEKEDNFYLYIFQDVFEGEGF